MFRFRRGQEEMVGFVLVVLLVAVIFLVFLGISFRSNSSVEDSAEASQFLDSILEFTSNCTFDDYSYEQVSDLLGDCGSGKMCLSGENSCDVLKGTVSELVGHGWNFEEGSVYKGYEFEVELNGELIEQLPVFGLNFPCVGEKRGADRSLLTGQGNIVVTFELCG